MKVRLAKSKICEGAENFGAFTNYEKKKKKNEFKLCIKITDFQRDDYGGWGGPEEFSIMQFYV